ncbi:MAG: hypothetical protein QOG87_3634 [Actinomycetota bacterium]|jgi:hypothetical protein
MKATLEAAGDHGSRHIASLLQVLDAGDPKIAQRLASGDMWNHMGSFFDNAISDPRFDREYRAEQLRLAKLLEEGGIASDDSNAWRRILLRWKRRGL